MMSAFSKFHSTSNRAISSTCSTFKRNLSMSIPTYSPPSPKSRVDQNLQSIQTFFSLPRFSSISRPYTPSQLLPLVGSSPSHLSYLSTSDPSYVPTFNSNPRKLWNLIQSSLSSGIPIRTLGAIDSVQASQYIRGGLKMVYVSGWATSATNPYPSNDSGPDLADYPYTAVPNLVEKLRKGLELQDRREWEAYIKNGEEGEFREYNVPLFADMDTGHGGSAAIMKLAKLFSHAGAGGVHIEDQLHSYKKCGHQGGKIVIPIKESVERLISARMGLDLIGSEMLVVGRSDSVDARLISAEGGADDAEWIMGVESEGGEVGNTLREEVERLAGEEGGVDVDGVEVAWLKGRKLMTFDEAAELSLSSNPPSTSANVKDYFSAVHSKPHTIRQRRLLFKEMFGRELGWDCEGPRTKEGFYRFKGGLKPATQRMLKFAPYVDGVWLETNKPSLVDAQTYARDFRKVWSNKFLVYNLSPSFNWSAHGFDEPAMKSFIPELGKEGFAIQLVSLAGIHATGLGSYRLAKTYNEDGMLAYVNNVQKPEKEEGVDVLRHQKWSGAEWMDKVLTVIQNGSESGSSMGEGSTEKQFD